MLDPVIEATWQAEKKEPKEAPFCNAIHAPSAKRILTQMQGGFEKETIQYGRYQASGYHFKILCIYLMI
jgi:hypothetical protein